MAKIVALTAEPLSRFSSINNSPTLRAGRSEGRRSVPNLLMSGPPGSGKTMLARALPSILPPMTVRELRQFAVLEPAAEQLLKSAVTRLHLSARSYHRVMKLGRTIADLAGIEPIGPAQIAEALQYRPRQAES